MEVLRPAPRELLHVLPVRMPAGRRPGAVHGGGHWAVRGQQDLADLIYLAAVLLKWGAS